MLILQTAFAGDVVLAIPLARAAKQAFAGIEVDFLVTPETAILLKNNPFVDRIWIYDKRGAERGALSFLKWIVRLRRAHFHFAIVPHRSIRSAMLVWGARIPRRVGFHRSRGAFFFTDVIPYPADVHEVERNFRLLQALGIEGEVPEPELFPGPEERREVDRFLKDEGIGAEQCFLAMAPGSLWPTKRWLPEGFARVAREVWQRWGIRSILLGGKEDLALGRRVVREGGEGVVNGMARLSLLASAELIRRSRAILTNDSAPLHLAVAVGTPVVAVFGPTVPAFGFAPYGEGHTVIQKELACRPCGVHGGKKCPRGHFRCMRGISPEEVIRALEGYLV